MKKTIIANWGGANQGKSATIRKVVDLLLEEYPLANIKSISNDSAQDIRIILTVDGLKIGIESIGDPNSQLIESLVMFSQANCDLILCSTRNFGSTTNAVEALKLDGYEVIWTTNYRSDSANHELLNSCSAKHIFELIKSILFERKYPEIVYKYRGWEGKEHIFHRSILLDNELYFASPDKFNDPFDCRIFENYFLIGHDELEEWINDKVQFGIDGNSIDEADRESWVSHLKNKFAHRDILQSEKNRISKEQQDKHYGVLSLATRWDSILMWSHYADCHKGYCVGFNEAKLRGYLFSLNQLIKGGQVSYVGYPKLKPPAKFDPEYSFNLAFIQTHYKSKEWEYEEEYRILKTIYPNPFTHNDHIINIPNECFEEVILGISIKESDRKQIIEVCNKKNIKVFQAVQVPFNFKISRVEII